MPILSAQQARLSDGEKENASIVISRQSGVGEKVFPEQFQNVRRLVICPRIDVQPEATNNNIPLICHTSADSRSGPTDIEHSQTEQRSTALASRLAIILQYRFSALTNPKYVLGHLYVRSVCAPHLPPARFHESWPVNLQRPQKS